MKKLLSKIDFSYVYSFLGEATLGLTFILYAVIGRILGPEQYGIFASANALAGILTFFVLFGFADLLSREVAANPSEGLKSTQTFLSIEVVNCLIVLLVLFPIARGLKFEGIDIVVCYLAVIAGGGRCTKQTLRAAFRGLGRFRQETISVSIERVSLFIISGTVLLLTRSLVWVVGTMALVRLLDTVVWFSYLKQKESLASPVTLDGVRQSFKMAYPFAISGVLWILYYQVDVLMLKAIAPTQEVGFYDAVYRLIDIFTALPRVVFAVSFPKLTRCYAQNPSQLPEKARQTALLLLVIVLPFITITGFLQTYLIEFTYGAEYLPAVGALALLLPSLSMKMFASLVSYFLQATRRERLLPFVLASTVCLNIAANAVLIPQLGAVGAALATLLSEVTFAVVGLIIIIRVGYKQLGIRLLLTAIMGLLVASVPSMMLYELNGAIALGSLVFGLGAIVLLMRSKIISTA